MSAPSFIEIGRYCRLCRPFINIDNTEMHTSRELKHLSIKGRSAPANTVKGKDNKRSDISLNESTEMHQPFSNYKNKTFDLQGRSKTTVKIHHCIEKKMTQQNNM